MVKICCCPEGGRGISRGESDNRTRDSNALEGQFTKDFRFLRNESGARDSFLRKHASLLMECETTAGRLNPLNLRTRPWC